MRGGAHGEADQVVLAENGPHVAKLLADGGRIDVLGCSVAIMAGPLGGGGTSRPA